jgi:hypothetical protein
MRVLVYAPYAINTPHYEAALEIIQRHLDKGDSVSLIGCNGELLSCDVNLHHNAETCLKCVGRRIAGLKLLSTRIIITPHYLLNEENKKEIRSLDCCFQKVAELEGWYIENFEIGYSLLSTLISASRDPYPLVSQYRPMLLNLARSALAVYRSIQNHIDAQPVDRVYVFNGRYAPMRAAFRACQSKGVECLTHEVGSTIHHYSLFENALPHDSDYVERLIRQAWCNPENLGERDEKGRKFYLDRAKGIAHTWFSFVKDQQEDLLPLDWNPAKKNIVIFSSSEDEFQGIDNSWKNRLYANQLDGLEQIVKSLTGDCDGLHLYLRLHPNTKGMDNEYNQKMRVLQAPFLTIIQPEEPVSSYALLRAANQIVTFGSTVGIEAVFWGVPSILVGKAFYENLGGTYNPRSHNELLSMIHGELAPKDRQAALMYGYFFGTFGNRFKYFAAESVFEGKFKGTRVKPSRLNRAFRGFLRRSRLNGVADQASLAWSRKLTTGSFKESAL